MSEDTSNVFTPALQADPHQLGANNYHFYRCDSCRSLLTFDDEQRARKTGEICRCGSGTYNPTNPTDQEWEIGKIKDYCLRNDIQPCVEAQL